MEVTDEHVKAFILAATGCQTSRAIMYMNSESYWIEFPARNVRDILQTYHSNIEKDNDKENNK